MAKKRTAYRAKTPKFRGNQHKRTAREAGEAEIVAPSEGARLIKLNKLKEFIALFPCPSGCSDQYDFKETLRGIDTSLEVICEGCKNSWTLHSSDGVPAVNTTEMNARLLIETCNNGGKSLV